MGHVLDLILAELARPVVRGVAAWATLAGVLADLLLAALPARIRPNCLLATLCSWMRGPVGTLTAGVLHPLVLGVGALALTLLATRVDAIHGLWWIAGLGGGALLALFVLLAGPDTRPERAAPMLLVGLAIAAVVRVSGGQL